MPSPAGLAPAPLSVTSGSLDSATRADALLTCARVSAVLAGTLGALCLLGWWGHFPLLTTFGGSSVTMMPNTALMCLLSGAALFANVMAARTARRLTPPLAAASFLTAALTLWQIASGMDLGIDGLIVARARDTSLRPVPQTALSFLLLSVALMALHGRGRASMRLSEWAAVAAASVGLVALLGLIFSAQFLYGLPTASPSGMALPTMLAILALAAGVMSARPEGPWVSLLASDELGAEAGRRLLYWLLGAPLLAALLQAGVREGLLGGAAALAAGVFIAIAAMVAAIVSNTRRLNAALLRRRREVEQLRQAAIVFESTNEAILIADAQANILTINKAYDTITGYSAAEIVGKNPRFVKSGRHDAAFYRAMWDHLNRDGAWQGEVWNRRKDGEVYAVWQSISAVKDDAGHVTHYVSLLADITALKQAEERLQHLAHHDPLTSLPNRLLFGSTLERSMAYARRHERRLALLFLDLDHFKLVNDTLGHPAGDRLLEVVAQRLRSNVRVQDSVARLGGDEFTVLLEDAGTRDEIAHLATKLIGLVSEPMLLEDRMVATSASVGIAIFPDDATTPVDLTRAADAALYRAKADGRHTFGFYTEELTRISAERLAIETRLRQAIDASELRLHYQPQFDMASGRLLGFEALVRWQHPDEGLLMPSRFIAVAEQSSLIEAIGDWVIREACRQARQWLDSGLQPRRIAFNLSGRQFLYDHVAETIGQAMRVSCLDGVDCEVRLEVEVTETVLHAGTGTRSADTLQALRQMGVRVAIDDFGTGYSSLAVLKHLPIDALKIDQLFVRGLPDDADSVAICRAIVSMAHSLGLHVIAEGVETTAQRDCLQGFGCDEQQGWLTGRAMPPEDVAALLREAAR